MLISPDGTHPVQHAPPLHTGWQARSQVSADVDEHASQLSGWRQTYDQLGGGGFVGRLDEAVGGGVQLFRERTSRQLRQRCEVWPGALWCGITVAHDGSRLDGRAVGPASVMLSGSDGGFELVSPAGHDIFGVVVDRRLLAAHAGDVALPPGGGATAWPVDPAQRQAALVRARAILALAAVGSGGDLRDAAVGVVADLLAARAPALRERGNASARRRLVAQVHDRVQASPERPPSVPELCAALHVSRRTLQYAFEQEAGVAPLAYLRSVRLNAVRRLLREGAPGLGVQAAAARWGFWNLSAFAADYRRQFGERASQTLARAGSVGLL